MPERYRKSQHAGGPGRGLLLYVLPLPLLPAIAGALATGHLTRLLALLGAFSLLMAGARLTRGGLKAEAEFRRRKVATAPRTPRKTLGAVCIGLGTFVLAGFGIDYGAAFGAVAGGLAALGAWLAYGGDPRGEKAAPGAGHGFSTEEIVSALQEAEGRIEAIENANREIRNPEMSSRLRRIASEAREILRIIEDDPGDLRRARKFLNTYLEGAQRVTEGFARTHRESPSAELETNFRNVLVTIESVFHEQREKLLADDVMDLDVQIEVLSNQLKREGVI